ncbi:NADH dehydrogenase [ubiquinone] 1 alpha subcomplex assembly factor 3 [Coccinella septempunctata]|uniref:NADH dehydrogenase [ubiquinone] 1 alpha subcomplex assembly factor 3 n=1 Tax=Coccinella septempunctata TaxID=41139 RepID=UPI001D083C85|nr:NADH dehydrogenase [ubiquinone] 1 alpha subcomplex assembly factor 3 [Coccinella septempunctata]
MMISNILRVVARRNELRYGIMKCNISQSAPRKYNDSGKTVATILNTEADIGLMIDAYSEVGFRLNNNFTILGPMLIFPRSVLSWKVDEVSEITEESLSLFTVLEPKIDILVIGIGDETDELPKSFNILKFMRQNKLNVEILPTAKACPTFNFLNYEGRYVAGALIPPTKVDATDDDILRTKMRYQTIYEQEVPLF